jgi:hypothetical protein
MFGTKIECQRCRSKLRLNPTVTRTESARCLAINTSESNNEPIKQKPLAEPTEPEKQSRWKNFFKGQNAFLPVIALQSLLLTVMHE